MANVKISELPSATTPLDGTETLPIVKSGVTDRVSVANLTAGRAVSALSLDVNSGSTSLTANFNSTNASAGYVSFQSSSTNYGYLGSGASLSTANATDLTVRSQNNLTFATGGGSERARFDSSGNFGIGTTSPGAKFAVSSSNPTRGITEILRNDASATQTGIQVQLSQNAIADWAFGQPAATNAFAFWYGRNTGADGTECARFTSSGYFKASNTGTYLNSTGTYSEFYQTADDVSLLVTAAASSLTQGCNGVQIYYPNATPNNTTATYLYCSDASAQRAAIRSNGGIANFQANDLNLSDRREKHDFAPAKRYLDVVCAIPVQTFKYIDQTDDEPTLGVVAQDVQAVAPELVSESDWGTADEPKLRLSVYQTDLQYALMKAIQDLAADNQQLRARVEALEAAQTAVR